MASARVDEVPLRPELTETGPDQPSTRAAPTSTPRSQPRPAPPPPKERGWGLPLAILIVGMFMSVLDTSIVNVAIPVIQKQFGVSTDQAQWITTSYSLCEGVVVPASAWLGERIGLRRLYIWSMLGFAAISALCGLSGNLETMVLFRILQAIPGGVIQVTCLTMIYRIVPPQKIGAAMGLFGLGVVVAPGIGPSLGGYLVEYIDWRLIYYINVPIGILGTIAAIVVLPRIVGSRGHRFDLPGFVCIAAACFALLLATSEGPTWGWTSYSILILFAAAINLIALFVVRALQSAHPLLDVSVFRSRPFVISLILTVFLCSGLFAIVFYIPQFLQNGQSLTPWHTGLVLVPQAMMMVVLMPVAGRLYDRFGARWPAFGGSLLVGVGSLLLSRVNVDIGRPELILYLMIWASGLGVAMMPVMTGGISSLPPALINSGSTFSTLTQRVAMALGLAVLTAMATTQQRQLMADRSALLSGVGADVNPRILEMQKQGPSGLLPLWEQLQSQVAAQTYSNVFLVCAVLGFLGAAMSFLLPGGAPAAGEKPVVH
jgi:EmrB/QacA subfamily drug resistance transporter